MVDSSVISKVFLRDEDHVAETHNLFRAFYAGKVELLTPTIAQYEVVNSIVKATRQRRLSLDAGRVAIDQFFDLAIEFVEDDVEPVIRSAYPVSQSLDRSIYDGIFLVVSKALGAPFVTADKPTWEAAKSDFDVVFLPQLDLP